jgi:hypothetical protein
LMYFFFKFPVQFLQIQLFSGLKQETETSRYIIQLNFCAVITLSRDGGCSCMRALAH